MTIPQFPSREEKVERKHPKRLVTPERSVDIFDGFGPNFDDVWCPGDRPEI